MDIFSWKEEGRIEVLASLAPSSQIVESTLRMRTPWSVKLAKKMIVQVLILIYLQTYIFELKNRPMEENQL